MNINPFEYFLIDGKLALANFKDNKKGNFCVMVSEIPGRFILNKHLKIFIDTSYNTRKFRPRFSAVESDAFCRSVPRSPLGIPQQTPQFSRTLGK
jgi:hypothetical protein